MKMQHELLSDKLDDRDTNASAVELIKSMADGTGAHRADALKFGLRKRLTSSESSPSFSGPNRKKRR